MGYKQYFGDLIWTHHAIERMKNRGLQQDVATEAFKHPDSSEKVKNGATEFIKRFNSQKVTVIAKQNEKSEWVVISAWIDPPLPGSKDEKEKRSYQEYQKASGWKKFFLAIKRQIGF